MANQIPASVTSKPQKVDLFSETVIYQGWPDYGVVSDTEHKWGIARKTKNGNVWTTQYVQGSADKKFQWSQRYNYLYEHLK